jgi:hypothetical protein
VNTTVRSPKKSPKVAKKTAAKQVTRKEDPPLRRQSSDHEGRRRRPVQAYIAAVAGWKREVGRLAFDDLVREAVDQSK